MQKPRYSQQVQPRYSQQVDRVYQLAWLREFRAILWKREARGKQQRRDAKLYSRTGTLSTDVPGHLRQAQVTGSKKPLTEQMEETSRQAENNESKRGVTNAEQMNASAEEESKRENILT